MSANKMCPNCGREIISDTVDGLCLKCLGRLAFMPEPESPGHNGRLRLGDYELLEEIARGGMGVVYRARQMSLNRVVALKVVLNGPFSSRDFVRRFRQEAQAIAALRHPNIVAVHEVGEDHGSHFLSLELVEGRNFAELVRERPLPARRAARYLKIIAEAVEHAHQRGVLHRDLKPSNILLDGFDEPRVTDFGLAKLATMDGELTVPGQVLGSPNYMPPEQAAGKFSDSTPASDVYSLGAILYELITGRPPFQGENLQSILAQVQDAAPVPPRRLNAGIPVDLETICLKCLQKEPARRYASAQALADDLGRFLTNEPIRARPVSPLEWGWLWCRRRPWLAAMSAGFILSVILGVAGITWQWRMAEFYARGEMKQRLIAENDAAETRLNLYAADMAVASHALQNGLPGVARHTLETWLPPPGTKDLRGFEWFYLWNLSRGDELAVLQGHQRTVTCTAFSPDGKRLATGSMDGTVRIWDVATHALVTSLTITTGTVWSVAFTPDNRWLMASAQEKTKFLDAKTWRVHTNFPGSLGVLSQSGNLLATAQSSPFFWEPSGPVELWKWDTGQLLGQLDQPGRALDLSADGRFLAVAGTNTGFSVWMTAPLKLWRTYPTDNPIWSLHFSPDGRRLLTTDWSTNATVWSLVDNAPPQWLSGHQLHVWSAVFSPDGTTIATTSSDQSARLWNATTLAPKTVLHGHGSEVWCAAFGPRSQLLATGGKDHDALLWSATHSGSPDELPHHLIFHPLFSPDGSRLITVNPDSGKSMLWNTSNRRLLCQNVANGRQIAGFSVDGEYAATFNSNNLSLEFWPPDQLIRGKIPTKQILLAGVANKPMRYVYLGMSLEQSFFFAIEPNGLIHVWNAQTGALVHTIPGPAAPIRHAILSPQGKQIVVCVEREEVAHLYDCVTGREHLLTGHADFISGLAFSPDDRLLATGSMDGTIRLWNTFDGSIQATLPGHLQETTDVAFSPDGRTLASLCRNESFKLWHVPTLREVVSEDEPHAGMWLIFSPDGRELAVETDIDKISLFSAPRE